MTKSAWLGLLVIPLLANLGGGAPVKAKQAGRSEVEPLGHALFLDQFESHQRACAIVIGDGETPMGLYVFDRWGNCIARDDYSGSPAVRDDLAVEWFPPEAAPYGIDVYNFGRSSNVF